MVTAFRLFRICRTGHGLTNKQFYEREARNIKSTAIRLGRSLIINSIKIVSLLLAVTFIAFMLVSLSPVDPVQQYLLGLGTAISPEQRVEIEQYWGLNEPSAERYFSWLGEILKGNWGESLLYRRPVMDIISECFANSLALMLCAWLFSGLIGFSLGCLMGMYQGRWPDKLLKKICYLMSSLPSFWLGLLLLLVFSVWLNIFPIGFSAPIGLAESEVSLWQRLHHLILPAFTLSMVSFANISLHTRQKLIEVLDSDYALFARARGEGPWTVLRRHGIRNILLPALTIQFASLAELFGGSVLAENVFSYPGLGSAVSAAGLNSDLPLFLGITLFSALFVCVGNMTANLLYGVIDPRIQEAHR